jgi:hypothetical protein
MSRFKVEKERVAASLTLATGQTVTGCFFVLGSLNNAVGRERVGDLLNAEDGFFPFQHDDGTTGQYNRAHVVLVRLPVGVDEETLEPGYDVAQRRNVVLTLSNGARIDGAVTVYGPVGYDRLSDYTRRARHFRYVVTPFGSVIVNADHIVEVIEKAQS